MEETVPIPWYEKILLMMGQKMLVSSKPIRKDGGNVDFFLFFCWACRRFRVNYRHGFDGRFPCSCGNSVY